MFSSNNDANENLSDAIFRANLSLAKQALDNDAKPNKTDRTGHLPLYSASDYGHKDIVQLLLNSGADPNLVGNKNDIYMSPLHTACSHGYEQIVELLLGSGADPNLIEKHTGLSPLHCASLRNHIGTAQLLLVEGANPNLLANNDTSSLYLASQNGHKDMVQLLLSNGADPDLVTKKKQSPLDAASFNNHKDTFRVLLEGGADPALVEPLCLKPHEKKIGNKDHEEIVQLLENENDYIKQRKEAKTARLKMQRHPGLTFANAKFVLTHRSMLYLLSTCK